MRLGDLDALEHDLVIARRYMDKDQVLDVAYRINKAPTIDPDDLRGSCDGCRWKGRHQKCSCCRRNRYMRDLYEEEEHG